MHEICLTQTPQEEKLFTGNTFSSTIKMFPLMDKEKIYIKILNRARVKLNGKLGSNEQLFNEE